MTEGGQQAVRADDDVVPAADLRRAEERVRELDRLLGRKTLEVEVLKEALELTRAKKAISLSSSAPRGGSR
jgi:transposase